MPVKCAFCPKPADSGEHIWDDWICRLPIFKNVKVMVREQLSPEQQVREWLSVGLGQKKKTVCAKCNNEWMSDVVNLHSKPCMEKLILSDARVELTPQCIFSTSIFTFLKAVVLDHAQPQKEPFFSMAVRSHFRRTLQLPPNIQIWIGCLSLHAHHSVCRFKYGFTTPELRHGYYLYTFTWGIGCFVVQLAAFKSKSTRFRNAITPHIPPHPFWDRFAVPIWPSDGSAVIWPPAEHLGDSLIDKFSDRFTKD